MSIRKVMMTISVMLLGTTQSFASSYYQSTDISQSSSKDWHWQLSNNYAAAMTDETKAAFITNHLGLICGDSLESGCNFALMRQYAQCPKANIHQLTFNFPTSRFSVDSVCVNSTHNTSIVLLPTEDGKSFEDFAAHMRNATKVIVTYNADLRTISESEFSLMGSAKAIKTVSVHYTAGYMDRMINKVNQEIAADLQAEYQEYAF